MVYYYEVLLRVWWVLLLGNSGSKTNTVLNFFNLMYKFGKLFIFTKKYRIIIFLVLKRNFIITKKGKKIFSEATLVKEM